MDDSRRRFIRGSLTAVAAVAARAAPVLGAQRRSKRREPLFADDFDRRDRDGWGPAWFNQRYDRHWLVRSRRGIFRMPPTENNFSYRPNPVLVLDHDVADIDIRTTVSKSNRSGRVGMAARATGYADYYVAYLAAHDRVRISRCSHQREIRLASGRAPHVANRRYRMRMQVRGGGPVRLRVKVWPVGTKEPLRWNAEVVDADPASLTTRGAFGMFFGHAGDRRSCSFRVVDFVARSAERPRTTAPTLAYSLTGPPRGPRVKLVAKTAVPATIAFETSHDPAFRQVVEVLGPKRTNRAQTAKGSLDISSLAPSSLVYWRAVAERGTQRVIGTTHSFRIPPSPGLPVRFAFGSCTKWQIAPRHSFEHARLKLPDLYLHQGDFGYAASQVAAHGPDTYQDLWVRMLMDPSIAALTRHVPFVWMRDDADYGRNNADRHSLRRFTIAAHDQLNANPGSYFQTRYADVAIFSIDCRRYSTGKEVPRERRSKLGGEQKRWLKQAMTSAVDDDVALLVLSSPQAFGSDANREAWRSGYREEWAELVDFFQSLRTPVLIVSGDAHGHRLHEYPQKDLQTDVPRIVEIVSSGTEQNKFFDDIDPQFLLKKAKGSGFGLVEVGPEETVGGQRTRQLTLTAIRTKDGTPFWTASYLIVKGVGLVPGLGA